MDWFKIIAAITIIGMMVMMYPNLKRSSQSAEKATTEDWMSFIKPMAFVVIFIVALVIISR